MPRSSRPSEPSHRGNLLPPRNGEAIKCVFCPHQQFRRSRLRTDDIQQLLQLRYPVRCLRCGERQYSSFTVAAISLPSTTKHPRRRHRLQEQKNWVEPAERMVLHNSSSSIEARHSDPERSEGEESQ